MIKKNAYWMCCVYSFVFMILVILFAFISVPLFSASNQAVFEYKFNNTSINLNDAFNLKVNIISNSDEPKFIDFDKDTIKEHGFEIKDFSYTITQNGRPVIEQRVVYELDFKIGISMGKFEGFGDKEFPAFEIRLISTKTGEPQETYQAGSKTINVKKPFPFNSIMLGLVISFFLIFILFLILVLSRSFLKKSSSTKRKQQDTELSDNMYRRFLIKKEMFRKNKDLQSYLNSLEKIVTSFALRKYSVTNIFVFFNDTSVSFDLKATIRNILRDIDKLKSVGYLEPDDDKILNIENNLIALVQDKNLSK